MSILTSILTDDGDQLTHYIYPNDKTPRYILPYNRLAAKSGLRFLTRLQQRIKMSWIRWLSPCKANEYTINRELREILLLSENDIQKCIIGVGAQGPYQKYVVLHLDQLNNPLRIYKIGLNFETYKLLKNEGEVIQRLSSSKVLTKHVPHLEFAKFNQNYSVLSQTVGKGKLLNKKYGFVPLNFLEKLRTTTGYYVKIKEANFYIRLHRHYQFLSSLMTVDWKDRYDKCLQVVSQYKNKELYLTLAHRDFVYWNMRLSENGIFIFDWEFAQEEYPIFHDYFHYFLIPRALGKFKIKEINNVLIIIDKIRRDIDFESLPLKIQLLLYFLDVCSLHLMANMGNDEKSIVVNIYADMIDYLLA